MLSAPAGRSRDFGHRPPSPAKPFNQRGNHATNHQHQSPNRSEIRRRQRRGRGDRLLRARGRQGGRLQTQGQLEAIGLRLVLQVATRRARRQRREDGVEVGGIVESERVPDNQASLTCPSDTRQLDYRGEQDRQSRADSEGAS